MTPPRPVSQVLDEEFLPLRAKLLEIAAGLDRLDRASGAVEQDSRYGLLEQAIHLLKKDAPGRAERLQLLFSRAYDANWRESMALGQSSSR
ncbi:MAG: hypothetical protein KDA37_04830 [Planctomycetales bacterium]|nr:hypothetical protein [Planctomycetales bacterium]